MPTTETSDWELRFRSRMRARRDSLKISQTEFARTMKAAGFAWHQQTVQRVEAGERPVRLNEVAEIARLLGTSVSALTEAADGAEQIAAYVAIREASDRLAQAAFDMTAALQRPALAEIEALRERRESDLAEVARVFQFATNTPRNYDGLAEVVAAYVKQQEGGESDG